MTDDLRDRIAALSPDKRALFERLLAERAGPVTRELSASQHGLWFIDTMNPGSPLYVIGWRCRLDGPLDLPAFTAAAGEVVDRHPALRTRFAVTDGRPVQVVEPVATLDVGVEDLAGSEVDERVRAEAAIGFDLSGAPLVRLRLLRTAPDRHVLVLLAHHLVFDFVSTGIFLTELMSAYDARAAGTAVPLPRLDDEYGAYALSQRDQLSGDRLQRLTGFWRDQLAAHTEPLTLAAARPRPPVTSFAGRARTFTVPADVVDGLRRLARTERVSLFTAFLTAFGVLMHRGGGVAGVNVGLAVDGRNRPEARSLIGFFINSVVARVDAAGDPPVRELLHRTRAAVLAAHDHQDLPFDQVVEAVAPPRSLSHNPLFQVVCSLDEQPATGRTSHGLRLAAVDGLHTGRAKFDLAFGGVVRGDEIEVMADYSTDLFDEADIDRLGEQFVTLLRHLPAGVDGPVSRLPVAEAAPEPAVPAAPPVVSVAEALLDRARRTPDEVAVVSGPDTLTWAALRDRATGFADRPGQVGGAGLDAVAQLLGRHIAGAAVAGLRDQLVAGAAARLGLTGQDVLAQLAPPASATALWEIGLAVTTGATLHIAEPGRAGAAGAVPEGATAAAPCPAVVRAGEPPVSLRAALLIGRTFVGPALDRWAARVPVLLRGYGPAGWDIPLAWTDERPGTDGADPLGAAGPGFTLSVRDPLLRPCPPGIPGELCVAVAGVRELVRTGERAVPRPDGTLVRLDHAVELRISAAIGAHDGIRDVETVTGPAGTVAFVVPGPADERALRAFLADRLPDELAPRHLVAVDRLPTGPDGDIDRDALPWPDPPPGAGEAPVAARTAVERVIAGMWCELLDRPAVGVHDDFFDLGGHSLLAAQLLARLSEVFGVQLPLRSLFRAATPAALSAEVTGLLGGAQAAEDLATEIEAVLRMSEDEVQARLTGLGTGEPHKEAQR